MTHDPEFHELVGDDVAPEEEARLRHVHDVLLAAGPPAELPPGLEQPSIEGPRRAADGIGVFQLLPRRRVGAALALAAAVALVAFFGGYLAGYHRNGFTAQASVPMHAVAGGAASATIKVGKRDEHGNWPLQVDFHGLPALKHGGYYQMYLTRGKKRWTCGTFAGGGQTVSVRLNIPYELQSGDGWIVTREEPGVGATRTVLST